MIFKKITKFASYMFYSYCVGYCTSTYIGGISIVVGPSMEPTLFTGHIILSEHVGITNRRFKKGDIVMALNPNNPRQVICKRIVGLPGDIMFYGLFFNKSEVVPIGHLWLEGDNAYNSADSRHFGPIPQGLVKSKAIYTIWPIDSIKSLQF